MGRWAPGLAERRAMYSWAMAWGDGLALPYVDQRLAHIYTHTSTYKVVVKKSSSMNTGMVPNTWSTSAAGSVSWSSFAPCSSSSCAQLDISSYTVFMLSILQIDDHSRPVCPLSVIPVHTDLLSGWASISSAIIPAPAFALIRVCTLSQSQFPSLLTMLYIK